MGLKVLPDCKVDFHLTEVLTGNGCFNYYLQKIEKIDEAICISCGHDNDDDDVEHIIFRCDRW